MKRMIFIFFPIILIMLSSSFTQASLSLYDPSKPPESMPPPFNPGGGSVGWDNQRHDQERREEEERRQREEERRREEQRQEEARRRQEEIRKDWERSNEMSKKSEEEIKRNLDHNTEEAYRSFEEHIRSYNENEYSKNKEREAQLKKEQEQKAVQFVVNHFILNRFHMNEQQYNFKSSGTNRQELEGIYNKLELTKPNSPMASNAKNLGFIAVKEADNSYSQGEDSIGDVFKRYAQGFLDVAAGLSPAAPIKDAIEGLTGKTLISQENLSNLERGILLTSAAVGIGASMASVGLLGSSAELATKAALRSLTKIGTVALEKGANLAKTAFAESARIGGKVLESAGTFGLRTGEAIKDFGASIKRVIGNETGSIGRIEDLARINNNPLKNTRYTQKVQQQMSLGDNHAFPKHVDNWAGIGTKTPLKGNDGMIRTKIEVPGSYKGKDGHFEWIIEPDKTINHRLFVSEY